MLKSHRARQAEERTRIGEHWVEGDWVFTHAWGGTLDPDNFRHRFIDLCDKAGIGDWSPHAARHTAGSLIFDDGADLKVVSEALGHSSIRVTRQPVHAPSGRTVRRGCQGDDARSR